MTLVGRLPCALGPLAAMSMPPDPLSRLGGTSAWHDDPIGDLPYDVV